MEQSEFTQEEMEAAQLVVSGQCSSGLWTDEIAWYNQAQITRLESSVAQARELLKEAILGSYNGRREWHERKHKWLSSNPARAQQ